MSEHLREFSLAVARAVGIGPRTFTQMLAEFGTIQSIAEAFENKTLPPIIYSAISESIHQDWVEQLQRYGLQYICSWEEGYPELLRQIADPPAVFFYVGTWKPELFDRTISVVGTRAATSQGKAWTESVVSELVAGGFTIVSGMAFGIDAAAHMSAIKAGGHTVAVLAGSAYEPSPQRNKYVYDALLSNGDVVLSETFPGTDVKAGMFASRNRVVAGLSQATLVIEADQKSGALITAELALGYGRQVFAIPGEPGRQMSRGCNELIKKSKAMLVESAQDILQELGLVTDTSVSSVSIPNEREQKLAKIDPSARIIYDKLQIKPLFLEQICLESGKNISEIISILTSLQVSGLVLQNEIGEYKTI
jgi:DNA processing protein